MRHSFTLLLFIVLLLTHSSASLASNTWSQVGPRSMIVQIVAQGTNSYALAADGAYVSTDDLNWTLLRTTPTSESLNSIVALTNGDLLLFGYAFYYRSTDHGQTWKRTDQPGFSTRRCISDIHDYLYAGTGDVIMRSTDKGATWAKSDNGTTGDFFDIATLVATPDGTIYAGNQGITGGSVYRSTNSGASWKLLYNRQMEDVHSIAVNGSTIFIAYAFDLVYSDNAGVNWKFAMNKTTMILTRVLFVATDEGYLGTTSIGLMHSHNHGSNWENATVTGISGHLITDLFKTSLGHVLAGTDSGLFVRESLSGVELPLPRIHSLLVSPNPAVPTNSVVLYSDAVGKVEIVVTNELGKVELHTLRIADDGSVELPIGNLTPGVHYIQLNDGQNAYSGSVLIK